MQKFFNIIIILTLCACDNMKIRYAGEDDLNYYNPQRQRAMPMQYAIRQNPYVARDNYRQLSTLKKKQFFSPKVREKKRPFVPYQKPDNFFMAESKSTESIYLEDVIFKDTVLKDGKNIFNGSKLFLKII